MSRNGLRCLIVTVPIGAGVWALAIHGLVELVRWAW